MKRMLSLLFVFLLCLSLCACGDGNNDMSNSAMGENNNSDTGTNTNINNSTENTADDPYSYLYGHWLTYTNSLRFDLSANGKGKDLWEGEIEWVLTGDELVIKQGQTYPEGNVSGTYTVVHTNGFYYLIIGNYTFVREDTIENIPITQVELTEDNWMEYLEVVEENTEIMDAFGEPTGRFNSYVYLTIKEAYRYIRSGEIVVRYSINEIEDDVTIGEGKYRVLLYSKPYGEEVPNIEIVKIQGTVRLFDGI